MAKKTKEWNKLTENVGNVLMARHLAEWVWWYQDQIRFGGGSVMMWAGIHHDGCTALLRVNRVPSAQIYWDKILQHHIVPLINICHWWYLSAWQCQAILHESAEIFYSKPMFIFYHGQHNCHIYPQQNTSEKSRITEPSKEPSATNTIGTVLGFTEWMTKHPHCTIQNLFASMHCHLAAVITAQWSHNDTEHSDTLWLIHIMRHTWGLTHEVQNDVAYSYIIQSLYNGTS